MSTAQRVTLSPVTTLPEALRYVASGEVTMDQFLAWDQERTERLMQAACAPRPLTCKVSEKGCLSVYGLNRQFPVSLYAQQWERLAQFMPNLLEFAKANADKLSRKG